MDINQGRRVQSAEEIRSPLQGVDLSLRTAQTLAESMDSISKARSQSMSMESGKSIQRGTRGVRLLNFGASLNI